MAAVARPLKPKYAAPRTRKEAIARGMPPVAEAAADVANPGEMSEDEAYAEHCRMRAILEASIGRRIREAQMAREASGIEEIWAESEDQYNGVDALNGGQAGIVKTRDQAVKRSGRAGVRSRAYLNITKPKTDTGVARVQEMLVPHDDKPWETKRTPVPDLDEAITSELNTPVTLGDGTQAQAKDVAALINQRADEAASKEALWIEDKFVEGSVYAEMRRVIASAGRLGTGVLKGPFPIQRTSKKWSVKNGMGVLEIARKIEPTSKSIRPQDFYPAPDCGDNIHDGSYCVERDFLTARKLIELAALPEYDQACISVALQEGPRLISRGRNDIRRDTPGDTFNDAELFEVFHVYCQLDPEELILLGLDESLLGDEERVGPPVAAIVTMLNGRALKAVLNPLETGSFPYDLFVWDAVDGQPWGRGIPHKMGVAQRGLNAAVRAQLENAGISGGPQVVFTNGAVTPVDGFYEITGRKLWRFDPTDALNDITKCFAVFNIPSMQEQLGAIIQFWLEMADVLTNLPILMQGMLKEGASPDTLGGMRLLMANMTSPLRVIAKLYDDKLIVPHLRRYHDWYMQDPAVPAENKGDTQIAARGATVLVQRAEDSEFLTMLYASKADPDLRLNPSKLVQEMARARGFNLASIQYTEDEWKQVQAEKSQQQAPSDPRVQAAEIRNQGLQAQMDARAKEAEAERQFKAEQAAADRASAERLASFEIQLQMIELAGEQQMSLAQVKAMLAGKAMDNRLRTDEMRLKLMPQNRSGMGI